jgi:hypothetical protein
MTTNKLQSELAVRTYGHDPADATVATKIAWVPMSELFMALATVISGAVVTFKIFAAVDSSGTTPTEVKAHATPTTADALSDQLVLEVRAAEVLNALAHASHVSVELDMNGANDTAAVTYVRSGVRFTADALTADVIS